MNFELTSTEKTISDICQLFGIDKLTPFKYDQLKAVIINCERNGKFDGVMNHNNWIATQELNGTRSLSINHNRKNNDTLIQR